ncbi:hypothetical protein SELMODRAFT_425757 [Selaginella moellendorffii]|uniref:Uncharacterized protein n=1 Tax=Selaginella moellendorffii TaxID=88036 RepID=D8SU70_SELML|nr:hypothetical protein SELMODRAFT_425757 [Selaginella moellendorffii]
MRIELRSLPDGLTIMETHSWRLLPLGQFSGGLVIISVSYFWIRLAEAAREKGGCNTAISIVREKIEYNIFEEIWERIMQLLWLVDINPNVQVQIKSMIDLEKDLASYGDIRMWPGKRLES